MTKQTRKQAGYALLGAAMLAIGVLVNFTDIATANDGVRLMYSAMGLAGLALLVVNLIGLASRGDD